MNITILVSIVFGIIALVSVCMYVFPIYGVWQSEKQGMAKLKEKCPKCKRKFSDWFFWPGMGNYCFPCYIESDRKLLIIAKEIKNG